MASIAFVDIAAAQAAGWIVERTTQIDGKNVTRLKFNAVGQPGASGREVSLDGVGASSGAADTAALANCNAWRAQRYGPDSGSASVSTLQNPAASPSTQGVAPTHASLTKDRH